MISKCANPNCGTPFRYYRDGKLFHIEVANPVDVEGKQAKKASHKVENFWLCGECSSNFTLAVECQKGVVVLPIRSLYPPRAIA